MFEDLKKRVKHLLKNAKTPEEKQKYALINAIMMNRRCFFEIPMETAYSILKDLEVEEETIKDVYLELISKTEFDNLY